MVRSIGPMGYVARSAASIALVALAGTVSSGASPVPSGVRPVAMAAAPPVAVQVLAINDFHGALEPPAGATGTIDGVPAGGVEYLAAELAALSADAPDGATITVGAGDLIGDSPLLSAAFHDEPTVEALDLAGLDLASVGNHEFDDGPDELLRIQNGGCHPVDGCADPDRPYTGADFQYLSANAFLTDTGQPLLPPYAIKEVGGVRVGFIGMTLEATPDFVTPSGVAGLGFDDEIATGDYYAEKLRQQGVETIVVLLHEGGTQGPGGGINDCTDLSGAIVPIAEGLSDAVDVVVSGHTHQAYNCVVDGKIVTSAGSDGGLVTDIDLRIDPTGGDVLAATARNVIVGRDQSPDPRETALIDRYRALLGPAAARVVGVATSAITRTPQRLIGTQPGESALGELVADAQLAATRAEHGAVAALVDPAELRADLDPGLVGDAELHAVLPFNNYLTTLDLTGDLLGCLLEQQFVTGHTLQPSATITYTVDPDGTTGTPTDPCAGTRITDLTVHGAPVDPATTYRITVDDFLADGGDGFTVFTRGTNRTVGGLDIQAFADYLTTVGSATAPATNRIMTR